MKFRSKKRRRLSFQPLEARRVLAASFGWDGPGLGSAELTYTINGSPSSLSQAETNAAIETAFEAWSSAADITFTPTNQTGLRDSIDISFVNIDGRAGTLAQAYFPDDINPARIAGDIQFDVSEAWEIGNSLGNRAFDLVWVAVHEIGHSLGLDHHEGIGSVLAPFVSPNQSFDTLSDFDAAIVQELYAAADGSLTSDVDDTPIVDDPVDETPTDQGTDTSDDDNDANDPGDTDDDPFTRSRWRRGGRWHRFGGRLDAELVDYNYVNTTDVNGDNHTSALDALMVINQLNQSSPSQLTNLSEVETVGLSDVNGDGSITALDALTVINSLNRGNARTLASVTTVDDVDATDESSTDEDAETIEELDDESVDAVDDSETPADEVDDAGDTTDPIDDGGVIDDSDDTDLEDPMTDDPVEEMDDEDEVEESDDEQDSHEHRHRHGGIFNIGLFGGDAEAFVSRFDTNDDASISEDEVSERLWSKLTDLEGDSDADGLVTIAELDALIASARQAAFDANDSDGDGLLTEDEVGERRWSKISGADANEDGGVSLDELDTFIEEEGLGRSDFQRRSHRHAHRASDAVFASIGRGRFRFSS